MSRNLERSVARSLYAKFARQWRHEKRLAGVYGKPGYRHPSFNEWYSIHKKDVGLMKESTPADVSEYLDIGADPWAGATSYATTVPVADGNGPQNPLDRDRGVTTINIAGNEDE